MTNSKRQDDGKNLKPKESALEQSINDALDDSLNHINDEAQNRLYAARRQSIQQLKDRSESKIQTALKALFSGWRPLIPLVSVASIAALVVVMQSPQGIPELQQWEDSELLFSADELELYEDLEFYAWLAEIENG